MSQPWPPSSPSVGSAVLLAEVGLGDVADAHLLDGSEPVGDHRVGHVVGGHADRDEGEVRDDAVAVGDVRRLAVFGLDADEGEVELGLDAR